MESVRATLAAKYGTTKTALGGKGSMRRKKHVAHKAANNDDKRLSSTLKRLSVTNIPAIEEVNLFRDDGKIIHFSNPKVQANVTANTYVVSGKAEEKNLQDLLPGILNQLGVENLNNLKFLTEQFQKQAAQAESKEQKDEEGDEEAPDLENVE